MIKATIIADSVSSISPESRITTFELEYPRFIHSELMTHRLFSRNAASSRAIPVAKMIEQVRTNPAMPVHWGKNQSGMQAKEELSGTSLILVQQDWCQAAKEAATIAETMSSEEAHKQIVNRLLEPFQWMKTVVTATEFDNFFWLRCHADAQPEIHVLADLMYEAYQNSTPQVLEPGEWHLPYVHSTRDGFDNLIYLSKLIEYSEDDITKNKMKVLPSISLEQALKISSSCCAQVSYRLLDDSLDKAEMIYDKLVNSVPVHASPFEHQATPMKMQWFNPALGIKDWEEGVTHADREANLWSGNLKGWIQHRQLIEGNVCNEYSPQTSSDDV